MSHHPSNASAHLATARVRLQRLRVRDSSLVNMRVPGSKPCHSLALLWPSLDLARLQQHVRVDDRIAQPSACVAPASLHARYRAFPAEFGVRRSELLQLPGDFLSPDVPQSAVCGDWKPSDIP